MPGVRQPAIISAPQVAPSAGPTACLHMLGLEAAAVSPHLEQTLEDEFLELQPSQVGAAQCSIADSRTQQALLPPPELPPAASRLLQGACPRNSCPAGSVFLRAAAHCTDMCSPSTFLMMPFATSTGAGCLAAGRRLPADGAHAVLPPGSAAAGSGGRPGGTPACGSQPSPRAAAAAVVALERVLRKQRCR